MTERPTSAEQPVGAQVYARWTTGHGPSAAIEHCPNCAAMHERLRFAEDEAVRQARIANGAMADADRLRETLHEVRLLGEQWKRSGDRDTRIMGADLTQILDGDAHG